MQNKQIKLSEIIRPRYDNYLNTVYYGNHPDFRVRWKRDGDAIVETRSWCLDSEGMFKHRHEHGFNVSEIIDQYVSLPLVIIDDVLQGVSYPS